MNCTKHYYRRLVGIYVFIISIAATVSSSEEPWRLLRPSLTARSFSTVHFATPSNGWAGGRRCIFHTRDSGTTWTEQHDPVDGFITSFFFHDTLNGWATGFKGGEDGYEGYLLRTSDGGDHWEAQDMPLTEKSKKILFIDRANGWVIQNGLGNNLFETSNSGRTWKPQTLPWSISTPTSEYTQFNDIGFCGATGIAVCHFTLFRTADGGATWTETNPDSTLLEISPFYKITMINDSVGYLIGWFGIARTDNGGQSWSVQVTTARGGPRFECLNYLSPDTAYALYGWNPVMLFKTVDAGTNWSYAVSNIVGSITEISETSEGNAVAVGDNGAVYQVTGALDSMSEVTSGNGPELSCVDFCNSTYGCAGKDRDAGSVVLTDNGGISWYEKCVSLDTLKPQVVTSVLRLDKETTFVGGYAKGLIYLNLLSTDNGNSWKSTFFSGGYEGAIGTIARVPGSRYGAWAITMNQELITTEDIRLDKWEKKVFPGKSISSIWQVGSKDSAWFLVDTCVLVTGDGAKTWDTLCTVNFESRDGIRPGAIFFVTPDVGWIGGIEGKSEYQKALFFKTKDGGKTWTRQKDVTLLEDPAIPPPKTFIGILKIWASDESQAWALDKRGLLHTVDGGKTWTECELPQAPVGLTDMYCDSGSCWVVGEGGGIWKQGKDVRVRESSVGQERSSGAAIIRAGIRGSTIHFKLASAGAVTFRVFTVTGQCILQKIILAGKGLNVVRTGDIPIPSGVYCFSLSAKGSGSRSTGRFVTYGK